VVGWLLLRRTDRALSRWWLFGGFAVQLGFLVSMYWGSEFFIGDREWMWKPETSLRPVPHSRETNVCRPHPNEVP